jgi:hypothetical protein
MASLLNQYLDAIYSNAIVFCILAALGFLIIMPFILAILEELFHIGSHTESDGTLDRLLDAKRAGRWLGRHSECLGRIR